MSNIKSPVSLLPATPLEKSQHYNFVRQHWKVTFARQAKMSVYARRILARVLDQIHFDDLLLRESYQVDITSLADESGITRDNAYREIERTRCELIAATWEFQGLEHDQKWRRYALLDSSKEKPADYQGGILTVILNPQLAPYFLKPKPHSLYSLGGYLKLHSWYSMRLYEILFAFRDKGHWYVNLDDYRQLLDCWHQRDKDDQILLDKYEQPRLKYPNIHDLIKNTTTVAQQELANRVVIV